ncbi:chemotaxis protein CheB [Saltatorellus ferox]
MDVEREREAPGQASESPTHVVGIGASAGGLEALTTFFREIPEDSRAAFVVVQHLSPDHESHMKELLARETALAIHKVTEGISIEPGAVYLIPPAKSLRMSGLTLLLQDRAPSPEVPYPIDTFFRSLADECGDQAIAVVLSGTGTDGSQGVLEVHERGGRVLVQLPESATFDGMPQSALATGIPVETGRPDELALIVMRLTHGGLAMPPEEIDEEAELLTELFEALELRHGVDFSVYKKATIHRRIARRSQRARCSSLRSYVEHATTHPAELDRLQDDLLIGVTRYRRDPEAFARLETSVLPKIIGRKDESGPVRVWAPGCATGEEAYSLAIAILEIMRGRGINRPLRIFATDVHEGALDHAARGIYSADSLTPLYTEVRDRYFTAVESGFQVRRGLRDQVVFARHDLLNQPPFTQLDLVCCRNLLIYFEPAAQHRALELFHFALKKGGFLFLGPSEGIAGFQTDFEVVDSRWRIWSKQRALLGGRRSTPRPPKVVWTGSQNALAPFEDQARPSLELYESILESTLPPTVLVDERFEVNHVFGGAERFLTLKAGRTVNRIAELVQSRLQGAVASAVRHCARAGEEVRYRVPSSPRSASGRSSDSQKDGGEEHAALTIVVKPVERGRGRSGALLVQFIEGEGVPQVALEASHLDASSHPGDDRLHALEDELQRTQENLQSTVEELETSNEELQASNEELVASNEELQSTNEELQSVNEELFTVNDEREKKIDQISREKADMDNLLQGTDVGVLFLDSELRIRRFTPRIAALFSLVDHDIGRPISTFSHPLEIEDLPERIAAVMEDREPFEVQVKDGGGASYLLRLLPYLRSESVQGVVLTLVDVTTLRTAEARLEQLKLVVENSMEMQSIFGRDGRVQYGNQSFFQAFGVDGEVDLEVSFMDVYRTWPREEFRRLFLECHADGGKTLEAVATLASGETIDVEMRLTPVVFEGEALMYAHASDVSSRKAVDRELLMRDRAMAASTNGIVIVDAQSDDLEIVYVNMGFERMTGYSYEEVAGQNCRFLQGEDSSPEARKEIREALKAKRDVKVTILNYRKDGTPFWNELQITPIVDDSGEVSHFVAAQNDITDRIHTQRDLLDARQRALSASRAKSRFLANMSHEIRSPMTAILGFADAIARRSTDPETLEGLGTIQRNAEYLLQLIGDILDISSIEANKVSVNPKSIDLPRLFADVVQLMAARAEQRSLEFSAAFTAPIPSIAEVDPTRLRQVLVNLLANAIKFTPKGRIELLMGFERWEGAGYLTFEVSDTGIGIQADELDAIFKPFVRPHAHADALSAEFEGSGLGLAIVKRLLASLRGTISVQSKVGQGSRFTVRIPLAVADDAVLVEELPGPAASVAAEPHAVMSLEGQSILVADDRADVAKVVRFYLEDAGAKVTTVGNGALAIDALFSAPAPFDVVVLDMQMPVLDGYDAARQMRRRGYEGPIIALTAGAMKENEGRCLDAGCSAFLTKPAEEADLIRLVASEAKRTRRNGS